MDMIKNDMVNQRPYLRGGFNTNNQVIKETYISAYIYLWNQIYCIKKGRRGSSNVEIPPPVYGGEGKQVITHICQQNEHSIK